MTIAATSAAVASFSGLRGLASAAGWPEHLAWLLPVTVDAYAMTSTRLWLAGRSQRRRARRFAAANALGAIASSVAGNAAYHAVSTGLLAVSWPIVVSVGAVPAAVLGLIAHLHALHTGTGLEDFSEVEVELGLEDDEETDSGANGDVPEPESSPAPTPSIHRPARKRRRYRTESDLRVAAQVAEARYREKHGRPITRDALRAALKISGPRATELRRHLAGIAPADGPAAPVPDAKEVAAHP
jgi:hypothetical protein